MSLSYLSYTYHNHDAHPRANIQFRITKIAPHFKPSYYEEKIWLEIALTCINRSNFVSCSSQENGTVAGISVPCVTDYTSCSIIWNQYIRINCSIKGEKRLRVQCNKTTTINLKTKIINYKYVIGRVHPYILFLTVSAAT